MSENNSLENLYEVVKTVRFELKPTIITNSKIKNEKIFEIKDKIDWVDDLLFYSKKDKSDEKRTNGEKILKEYLDKCSDQIDNLETIGNNLKNNKYIDYKIGIMNGIYVKKFDVDLYYTMRGLGRWYYHYPDPNNPRKQKKELVEFLKTENQISLAQLDSFPKIKHVKFTQIVITEFEKIIENFRNARQTIENFLFENITTEREDLGILAGLHTKEERISKIKLAFGLTMKVDKYLANTYQFYLNKDQQNEIKLGKKADFDIHRNVYLNNKSLFLELQEIIDTLNFYTNNEKLNPIRKWSLNVLACNPRIQSSGLDNKNETEIYREIFEKESELEKLRQRQAELKILKYQIKQSIGLVIEEIEDKFYEDEQIKVQNEYNVNYDDLSSVKNNRESVISFITKQLNLTLPQWLITQCDSEIQHILDCLHFTPTSEKPIFALKCYTSNIGYFSICNEILVLLEFEQGLASKVNQLRKDIENVRITHFGRIIQQKDKYFLALEKLSSGLDNLHLLKTNNFTGNTAKIIEYNSMTFKALRKLCIDNEGTVDSVKLYENEQIKISKVTKKPIKEITDLWGKYIKFVEEKTDFADSDFERFKAILTDIFKDNQNLFSKFNFDISGCKSMKDLITNINENGYKVDLQDIDFEKIKASEQKGEIELYQIYNKDFILDLDFGGNENQKQKDDKYKPNLYTIYWRNLFGQLEKNQSNKVRISPEGKFYIKLLTEKVEEQEKIFNDEKAENGSIISKKRKTENKIYGDFQLIFNPVRSQDEAKNKVREAQKSKDSKTRIETFNEYLKNNIPNDKEIYVIGLDRGENSLVSYALCKFVKKIIEEKDVKVIFDAGIETENWVLDEIIEVQDLSAVKIFNKQGNWQKNQFVEQKNDEYFIEMIGEKYDENKNLKNVKARKVEIEKLNDTAEIIILPIRSKEMTKSGAFALKYLSWSEKDGKVYNYRVAQELLKEKRLKQKEELNQEMELIETQKFKDGFVSQLVGFLGEKVEKHNAFISFEDLNHEIYGSTPKESNRNKTFGASIYQIIENKLARKFGYLKLKSSIECHLQISPRIIRIDELKTDTVSRDKKNKDYQMGYLQITDEYNTSKVCPNCGYSKANFRKSAKEINKDSFCPKSIDSKKFKHFKVSTDTIAYRYKPDGIATIQLRQGEDDFLIVLSDTRQNETKSHDFIRCIHCGFDSRFPEKNSEKLAKINGGDTLAAYNIAKRGSAFISSKTN